MFRNQHAGINCALEITTVSQRKVTDKGMEKNQKPEKQNATTTHHWSSLWRTPTIAALAAAIVAAAAAAKRILHQSQSALSLHRRPCQVKAHANTMANAQHNERERLKAHLLLNHKTNLYDTFLIDRESYIGKCIGQSSSSSTI